MVSQIRRLNEKSNFSLIKKNQGFSLRNIFIALIFLNGFFGLGYIFQVNKIAIMGYEIRSREEQINVLEKETDKLKIDLASLQSIYILEEKKDELGMVSPTKVDYLELNVIDRLVLAE